MRRGRWTLRALKCAFVGHDDLLAHEPGRLFLRCAECGRETAGWTIGPARPRSLEPTPQATELRPIGPSGWIWRGRDGRVAWKWSRWRAAEQAAAEDERQAA